MLRRFTFWLRCTWQKLPVQVSVFGWPPLLSHSLAFIIGTLVLQRGEAGLSVPRGKILVPVGKVGRVESDGQAWKETQALSVLQRRTTEWCRTSDDSLKLWKAPGRSGELYVLWPGGTGMVTRLQQLLQKKAALTALGKNFAFCGREEDAELPSPGVQYD